MDNKVTNLPEEVYVNIEYVLDRGENIQTQNIKSPYILKNIKIEDFILFSEEEAFIWVTLQKNPNIKDLVLEYYEVYNHLPWNLLNDVLNNWKTQNLILDLDKKIKVKVSDNLLVKLIHLSNKIFYIKILTNFINYLYRVLLKSFVKKNILIIIFIFGFIGNIYLSSQLLLNSKFIIFNEHSSLFIFICVVFLSFISILIHEIAHGIALNKFGIKVKLSGIKLYNFIPLFFVDVTESWLKTKSQRIIITSAGIFVNFCLAGISTILYLLVNENLTKSLLAYFAIINLTNFALNLVPFIQLDGYYLLIDLTNTTNIIDESKLILKKLVNKERLLKNEYRYIFFALMYYFFIIFFLILTLRLLFNNIKELNRLL